MIHKGHAHCTMYNVVYSNTDLCMRENACRNCVWSTDDAEYKKEMMNSQMRELGRQDKDGMHQRWSQAGRACIEWWCKAGRAMGMH
jgi:hypothetical protein